MGRSGGRRLVAVGLVVATLGACASGSGDRAGSATTATTVRDAAPSSTSSPTTATSTTSAGCRQSRAAPAGRSEETVTSGGRDRTYLRYVPKGLDQANPAPLVIDFTAYSPASLEESFSGFTKAGADGTVKADEVGAVVVTPDPVNGKGLLTWNIADTPGWTDDQRFVADLIDDVAADACIDADRVLAMGFAIGGVMASTVACQQPERITVVATVSGLWDPPGCEPSKPTPIISFHGTGDHFLPFDGGVGDRVSMLSLSGETTAGLVSMASRPDAVKISAAWAARNGCNPKSTERPAADTVTRKAWSGCDGDAEVELYVIDGGSHSWPGSNGMAAYEDLLGPVSDAVDANDLIWDFFTAQAPPPS